MTETKRCCEVCEYTHYQTDEFDRGVGLIRDCRNSKCECHTPVSEQKSLHSTEEAQATTSTIITYTPVSEPLIPLDVIDRIGTIDDTPTPPPTGRTDEQNKAILDHARPLIEENRRLLGLDTTPPPTGNYFQYRADPSEKKLEFDAPPTEWWLQELHNAPFYKAMPASAQTGIEFFITQALAEQKARMVEVVEAEMAEWSEDKTGALAACRHIIKALSK